MSNPPRHLRLVYSGVFGTLADPFEEWSFSLAVGTDPNSFQVMQQLQDLAEAARARWSAIAPVMRSVARLTNVRCASVGPDGLYDRGTGGAYMMFDATANLTGGATGSLTMPLQVSCAVGLRTAVPQPWGRGRFFLPVPNVALDTDGRMTTASRDSITTNARTFINGLNTDAATVGVGPVVVASGGSVTRGVPAANRVVTAVECGRRLDIQKRRANDQAEDHVQVAL